MEEKNEYLNRFLTQEILGKTYGTVGRDENGRAAKKILDLFTKDKNISYDDGVEYVQRMQGKLKGKTPVLLLGDVAVLIEILTGKEVSLKTLENVKKTSQRTLGDYNVWYQPCERCGYDTAKSTLPKEGNKTCWKCGYSVERDYSERALKPKPNP